MTVSGTLILTAPKPSLRRLVSPPLPCLASFEALAPSCRARARRRIASWWHHIIDRYSFAAQSRPVVSNVREQQPLALPEKDRQVHLVRRESNLGKETLLLHVPGYRTVEAGSSRPGVALQALWGQSV